MVPDITSVDLGAVAKGTQSKHITVRLVNNGTTSLKFYGDAVAGDYYYALILPKYGDRIDPNPRTISANCGSTAVEMWVNAPTTSGSYKSCFDIEMFKKNPTPGDSEIGFVDSVCMKFIVP